jgi:hypothetical protein
LRRAISASVTKAMAAESGFSFSVHSAFRENFSSGGKENRIFF